MHSYYQHLSSIYLSIHSPIKPNDHDDDDDDDDDDNDDDDDDDHYYHSYQLLLLCLKLYTTINRCCYVYIYIYIIYIESYKCKNTCI